MLLVVATADVQFEFPGSVVTEFNLDAAEFKWWAGQTDVDGHRGRSR